jgi:hypothetical protein
MQPGQGPLPSDQPYSDLPKRHQGDVGNVDDPRGVVNITSRSWPSGDGSIGCNMMFKVRCFTARPCRRSVHLRLKKGWKGINTVLGPGEAIRCPSSV